jgi:acyl-coenzyme A thioesterase PaaI-like protein
MSQVLDLWKKSEKSGFGRWFFSFMVCRKAPYFSTIKPRFEVLEVGRAQVSMKKRRGVENHIGTVHAIAMCNLAELAGGTMTEVSIPRNMRWLPKGMTVEYVRKAETDITAHATLPAIEEGPARDVQATVEIKDKPGNVVCRAVITMYVSPKKKTD